MAEIKTRQLWMIRTKDRADYYSGITRITINGKNAYELKGKFLADLLSNAFSGTNGKDAIEHIDYFLKIVDPIKLSNVNYERIRLAIFPISLVGNSSEWFDEFKEFKEFNFLLKVDLKLFTHDIERTKTYEDYENELNDELEEPWYNELANGNLKEEPLSRLARTMAQRIARLEEDVHGMRGALG
ncbi:hypothetical protein Tco_0975314 [Tanacetum coccineum]|uniref:Uncharacterized protein n=1 Tax=Tanacetum coccineum TaxID=301880 RepID=A0ABQ5EEC2_9ASTR